MADNNRGKIPSWNKPAALRRAVDAYFLKCKEENNKFPDYTGMLLYLQMDEDDVKEKTKDDAPNAEAYRKIFKITQMRRESWLVRTMVSDKNLASGCMNALKQDINGGYNDKASGSGENVLKIKVEGIKGGMDAFR